jgi:hypothetical protein
MTRRIRSTIGISGVLCLLAAPAWAQDDPAEAPPEAAPPAEPPMAEESAAELDAPPEAAPAEAEPVAAEPPPLTEDQAEAVADAQAGEGATELPGKTYRFIGARYRGIIVPKFMVNLFASGGASAYVHAFGPEFAFRKDGFEYNLGLWLGLYGQDETPYKGKDDPEPAWEHIESEIKILYFTSDFLWSQEFSPEFSLNYGVGAGFGIVFGNLFRTQVYPGDGADINDPGTWTKCSGPTDPADPADYCDTDNDHYDGYTEPSWANGGSKPIVFPWLALQTGLRYKMSRRAVARLDLGFGTSGFFFGVGADYGL